MLIRTERRRKHNNMKPYKMVVAVGSVALALAFTNIGFCDTSPGDSCNWWTGTYAKTFDNTVTVKVQLAVADQTIGPNPCNETSPPSKTASTTTGTDDGTTWEVSGGIAYSFFSVGAKLGGARHTTYGASCSATINQWCAEAHERAGVQHSERTVTLTCSTDGTDTVTGVYKSNYASYCDSAPPDSTPNCKTTCP